jgi:Glycosyl transferase family 8
MTHRGAIYCATNHILYLEAALISALALRQLNPDLPITLLCDQPLCSALPLADYGITTVQLSSDPQAFASRNLKTQLADLSPYTETLYIDSDILPLKSIAPIWHYLDQGDIAMALDRLPTVAECDHIAPVERDYTLAFLAARAAGMSSGTTPGSTTQFNSGVMLWRQNPATQTLFEQWQQEWLQFRQQDQLALVRAIATTQAEIIPLPVNYNISPIDSAPVLLPKNEVYLLHCWGGRVASGDYRRIAEGFYPDIVATVTQLLQTQDSALLA